MLTANEQSILDNIIALKNTSPSYELESRITKQVSIEQFKRFAKFLSSHSDEFTRNEEPEVLDINFYESNRREQMLAIRYSIVGLKNIQNYCRTEKVGEDFRILFKDRVYWSEPKQIANLDVRDLNFKINLKIEESPSENGTFVSETAKNTMTKLNRLFEKMGYNNVAKTFRFKKRVSFITSDKNYRIDLTMIKSSKKDPAAKNELMMLTKSFKESNVLNESETYEIEIEYIGSDKISDKGAQLLELSALSHVKLFSKTDRFLSNKQQQQIRESYCSLLKRVMMDSLQKQIDEIEDYTKGRLFPLPGIDKEIITPLGEYVSPKYNMQNNFQKKLEGITASNFRENVVYVSLKKKMAFLRGIDCTINDKIFIPKVMSIAMSNLNEIELGQKTPNLSNAEVPYTVTDKADGETMGLYCMDTRAPEMYLIDTNMNVYPVASDYLADWDECRGSILIGEFINKRKQENITETETELDIPNLYVFDMYVYKNMDARLLPLVSSNDAQPSRIVLANRVAIALSSARNLNIAVKVKEFRTGNMFSETKAIWDRKHAYPYDLDGVIYTPAEAPVAFNPSDIGWSCQMNTTWIYNLKWKPAEENSIDFLVRIESEQIEVDKEKKIYLTRDKIRYKTVGTEIRSYKTLHLYNGLRSTGDPCAKSGNDRQTYGPTKFTPTNPNSPNAYIAHIFIDKNGNIVGLKDGARILDSTIVEFGFDIEKYRNAATDDERAELWRPLRTRIDRTEAYKKGQNYFGNNFEVANSIWTSIHYPITEQMITTGRGIPKISETQYYNRDSTIGRDKSLTIRLQVFHNAHIKDLHQYKKANDYLREQGQVRDYHLLEMACGKGGDMFKWNKYGLNNVVGMDLNYSNIFDPKDGACKRYSDFVMKHKDIHGKLKLDQISFLYGDISENIRSGQAAKPPTLEIQQELWGKQYNRRQFDIISIQFALHYLFESESKLDGFLRNVSENLRPGGVFMGTCFDGNLVYEKLRDLKKGQSIEGVEDGKVIFKIKKRYENRGDFLPADASSLGLPIEVYVASINQSITEFLMSYDFLVAKLAALNIVPLETGLFEQVYKKLLPEDQVLSPTEQTLSFLNRYFIFRKLENDEQKINRVMEMIEQQKKVEPFLTILQTKDWSALKRTLSDIKTDLTLDEFQIVVDRLQSKLAPVPVASAAAVPKEKTKKTAAAKTVDCVSLSPEECKQNPDCVLGKTGKCSKKRTRNPVAASATTKEAAAEESSEVIDLTPYFSNEGKTITIPKEDVAKMDGELLISAVAESSIDYPLLRYFVKNPQSLFRNVLQYEPEISSALEMMKYRWLEPSLRGKEETYRGKPFVFVQKPDDYNNVDRLTDIFTEYARIQAKRHDRDQSPQEYFQTHRSELVRECLVQTGTVDSYQIRELLWKKGLEATNFKISLAISVYKHFDAQHILDISAGWGDRLIAAMGHQAQRYLAYDPNKKLMNGHFEIIKEFKGEPGKYTVRYLPFQEADLDKEMFDLIFTSPPYFDLEVYDTNAETAGQQSIAQFRQFDEWMVSFLFRSLKKAWDHLIVGGNMVIHITDFAKNRIVEPMVLFVLSNCPGARFDGAMGTQGASGRVFPMWAFYKDERTDKDFMSAMESSLLRNYPTIVNLYASVFGKTVAVAPLPPKTVSKDTTALVQKIKDAGFPFVETFWTHEDMIQTFSDLRKFMVKQPLDDLETNEFINYAEYDLKREKAELARFVRERKPDIRFNGRFITIQCKVPVLLDDDYLLVDYFTEPAKIKVQLDNGEPSLEDHFYRGTLVSNAVSILKRNITPENLHALIVNQTGKMKSSEIDGVEKRVYISSAENVFVYIILVRLLYPYRPLSTLQILDGAAGFGSRLMAAIMMDANYVGVEPNPFVVPGLNKMISMLGDPSKQRMIQDGLPTAPEFRELPEDHFDVIFFSPPMWGMEIYNQDDANQSINMFQDEQTWLSQFLIQSLEELWKRLKVGGFIVFQSVRYDYIGNYMHAHHTADGIFKGIISRLTSSNRHKPNWIWQKQISKE